MERMKMKINLVSEEELKEIYDDWVHFGGYKHEKYSFEEFKNHFKIKTVEIE